MQDYKIVVFPQGDYDAYHQIVNSNIDEPVSLDTQARRKWWCFDNPNGGAFAVALAGGKVVSNTYISGKLLILNGTSYKAYELGESATAPAHQRKGLLSRLIKACTSYAFDAGADAVYGTPNGQAAPAYPKLNFDVIYDPRSHLFVSPNITGFMAAHSDQLMIGMRRNQNLKENSYQISSTEFFNFSKNRSRLNLFSDEYFKWRFSGLNPNRYEFYRRGEFSMAVRESQLGKYKVLMVSDFGYEHAKPSTFEAIAEIRKIFRHEFSARSYAGIYFNCEWDDSVSRLQYGLKKVIHHRPLPICVMANGNSRFIEDLRSVALPQLSDCDIG